MKLSHSNNSNVLNVIVNVHFNSVLVQRKFMNLKVKL